MLQTPASLVILLSAALAATLGCAAGKSDGWKFADSMKPPAWATPWVDQEPESQPPARMLTSWTHTVLHRAGEKPKRGFGGRLIFFGRESDQPINVAGQLVIYAFDEADREAYDTHPTRRYIYPPDQFARLESDNRMGTSYSVWVPWDEVGGPQKNISLIARFEPLDGPLILGEQTQHLLPGTLDGGATPKVQLASHVEGPTAGRSATKVPAAKNPASRRASTLKTTSIPLPKP